MVAGAVLVTCIVVRIGWCMSFNAVVRWRDRLVGFNPPRPMLRPSVGSGLILSWSGMRGIVSLAAAMALPAAFPYRGLIVLTAFAVVLGTLVIQGLTLKPLLRLLNLRDDDPVGHEVQAARDRALQAALAILAADASPTADIVRQEVSVHLTRSDVALDMAAVDRASHGDLRRRALDGARQAIHAMPAQDEIGDDAFHQLEEELDWLEMAGNPATE
jgi:CPA1 family monovalent cation:H+ antiporter